jgi:hypothetical protein
MRLGKVDNQLIKLGQRMIKFLGFGTKDVQDIAQALPFGIDSAPVKDMIAVYSDTATNGEAIVIGYITKSLVAETGELRLYSTNTDGEIQTYVRLTNQGKIQLAGTTHNAVRYTPLETAFNELKTDFNNLVTTFNLYVAESNANWVIYTAHTHLSTTPGTPTGPAVAPSIPSAQSGTPSTADVSGAKIDEIQTI